MNELEATDSLIAISSYSRLGGSTRVRLYDWLDWLGKNYQTYEFLGRNTNDLGTIIKTPKETLSALKQLYRLPEIVYDKTVILSRQASPFGFGGIESKVLKNSALGIYDFDDALFTDQFGIKSFVRSNRQICNNSLKAADVVIAGNDYLADYSSNYSNDVFVIPSCINGDDYQTKSNFEIETPPTAVWMGSGATEKYLLQIEKPLIQLNEEVGLRVKVIGNSANNLGTLESIVDRVQWSELTYSTELKDADFGIMPLSNDSYSLGKCAYKILQYAATALPIIASPVGANVRAIELLGAFPATSSDDWVDQMRLLISLAPSQRKKLGHSAQRGVLENYSFDAWEEAWLTILSQNRDRPVE